MAFKSHIIGAACTCLAVVSFSANSAMVGRLIDSDGNFQAYYDTEADLTWLADANYAVTSGYAVTNATGSTDSSPTNIQANGEMGWEAANTWANGLNINGVTGWRLSDIIDVDNDGSTYTNFYQGVDYGYNITVHGEMSNLYYNVLGNLAYYDTNGSIQSGWGLQNTGPFINIQTQIYWTAKEYTTPGYAWQFSMGRGIQGSHLQAVSRFAWAVHDGDVSAIPIPAAAWLFGSGLIGLIGVARRKKV